MPQPTPTTPSPPARAPRRVAPFGPAALSSAALGSAALCGLATAGVVWLAALPALDLLNGRAERDLAAGVAALRLAEASARLTASAPLLAGARSGPEREAAIFELRAQARDLAPLVAAVGRTALPRGTAEGLRRPLAGMDGEIDELDRSVEARIAAEAELHNALTQVPERHAALRAALASLGDDALRGGARSAELLGLRDAIAERAQRLADRLVAPGSSQEAFRADSRVLEGLLARLPIGATSVAHAETARQLMALGLDTGNMFDLRRELARLNERIAGQMNRGRAKADDVSQLARRTADGLRDTVGADHAGASTLLRAAPLLAGALAGLAVLGAPRRRAAAPVPGGPAVEMETAVDEASGLRVLLAEDEPMTRTVAAALLRRAGHRVTVVGDGAAALAAVTAQPFDLVLLDLRMPVMDGLEALRRIRALPDRARAGVRVAVLTASAVPADAERCCAAGADAVLGKPLRLDALLPVLEGGPPVDAPDEAPVFDPATLAQMLDALPAERVGTLIGGTLATLADYRTALRTAWANGDDDAVSAMAHKIAGVAGVYGCPALRQAAQALERGIEAGDGAPAPLMDALDAAYGPALTALEQERGKLPSPSPSPNGCPEKQRLR